MEFEVAIASYKRQDIILDRTLNMCKENEIPKKNITVFVADDEEYKNYKKTLSGVNLVVGIKGISNQRSFISRFYDKNTPILCLDDDIEGLYLLEDKSLVKCTDFYNIAKDAFSLCKANGCKLWGINPTYNHFFMKNEVTFGLRYICGICQGMFAGDPALLSEKRRHYSSGEDYESTLLYYSHYGSVMRLEWICPKTKYFQPGGIRAELGGKEQRELDHTKRLKEIVQSFPDLATITIKAGGVTNIRLKTKTLYRLPRF